MSDTAPTLVAAMLDPRFYPHAPESVELRETHISRVFLAGELAYKVKKPLTLPFLDYGTPERRRELSHQEITLNDRFAPGVYVEVAGIAPENGSWRLVPEDSPDAAEYAVVMRRFDEQRTLAALAQAGKLEPSHVVAAARRIAELHAGAAAVTGEQSVHSLFAALAENIETMRSTGKDVLAAHRLDSAQAFTLAFEAARRAELFQRARDGQVRECHGDLRAEHVIVPADGDVHLFDCVEFDSALRQIDVGADLGFLYMDLMALAGEDAALRLAAAYREAGGEAGDDALLAFFAAYRAWVRAKVACLRAAELDHGSPERAGAEDEAGVRFRLGHRLAWRARRPLVLIVAGVSGTGKTTIARELGEISGWTHLSSDLTRKRLAGVEPTERAAAAVYSAEATEQTYRALGELAREELDRSGGVIVDATFNRRSWRDAFRSGLSDGARTLFIECTAPREVLVARIRQRASDPAHVSDADEGVLVSQLESREPLDEVDQASWAALETGDAEPAVLATMAEQLIDERIWAQ